MDDWKGLIDDSKYEQLTKPTWVSNKFSDNDLMKLKNKGNMYFKNGEYEQALHYYLAILHRTKHANKNSKLIIDSYNNIALVYFKIGRYYQCIDKCDIVLQLKPNQEKALFRRKKCYSLLQNQQKQQKKEQKANKCDDYPLVDKKYLKKMGIINSPLYEVRKIPFDVNKFGFFATKNIKAGTFILKENALFKYPINTTNTTEFSPNGDIKITNQSNKNLENILSHLSKPKRDIFKMMKASDIEMKNHFHNIYLTNNIVIDDEFGGIFPTGSRLNHCCFSNTAGYLNKATSKFCTVAVTDIKKGEQIFTSYCGWTPMERNDRREKLLRLYGFICECKYCNFETFNKYETLTKEFVVLRKKLFNFMRNHEVLKKENPFDIIKRIMFILKNCYDSNAYFLDDYTEHAFLCALVKNDFKHIVRYTAEHAFWSNVKYGYIVDTGKKQFEHKFSIPQTLTERDWNVKDPTNTIQKVIYSVIAQKKIPDALYQGPFAE